MSEGRKRSRKSKLRVRDDDCDFEIVTGETTTKSLELQKTRPLRILDHDYCIPGSRGYTIQVPCDDFDYYQTTPPTIVSVSQVPGPSNIELSVKVEVEAFLDNPPSSSASSVSKKSSDLRTIMEQHRQKALERERRPGARKKEKPSIKMCKYNPETIYSVSDHIASTSKNIADTILDIEMRNMWGNVLYTPHETDPHDRLVEKALDLWQTWFYIGRNIRDSPLFYQCHICNVGWWRLYPFQLHIRSHEIQNLKVTLKENIHECIVVASYGEASKLRYIDISEDCWRCGRSLRYHKENSQGYSCSHCTKGFYTCVLLKEHEARCMTSNIALVNAAVERKCNICRQIVDSAKDIGKHMIESHTPRSDIPMPSVYKVCCGCNQKYYTFFTHNCSKSAKNSGCNYCCRKFATKPLAINHMLSPYNRSILCRICEKPLQTRCMEMQHMHEAHSKNYQFAFKCTMCANQYLLFIDELSVKVHRELWHNKKFDRRRAYYEQMLVPRNCLQESTEEPSPLPVPSEIANDVHIEGATLPKLRRLTAAMSSPEMVTNLDVHRTPDVDVTIDEVDIKKEPECDENGEVNYEEMLNQMFSIGNEEDKSVNSDIDVKDDTKDYDFSNVKVKTEPVDDIDIQENPVEMVQVKTEPVDYDVDAEQTDTQNESFESVNIKIEPDAVVDIKIETESIEIKDIHSVPILKFVDNSIKLKEDKIKRIYTQRKKWSRRMYICRKCGYTNKHKEYKHHITMNCAMSPTDKTHKCTKCNECFFSFREYMLHFERHGFDMSCPVCGVQFDSFAKLGSHVQKHIKGSFIQFRVLDQKKVNTNDNRTSRLNREYKCSICHDIVAVRDLFKHWEQHLSLDSAKVSVKEEPPELAVDCERITVNNKILDAASLKIALDHLISVDASEKMCSICLRSFTRRYDVKRHIIEHLLMDAHMKKSLHRGFRCQLCLKQFERPEKYKFHMREHGCMPIYKCELCNKTFSDSSNFAKHKKTHNVGVLICDLCKKKFHIKSTLEKHIAEHPNHPTIQCQFCDKTFCTKSGYKKHKYAVHQKAKFRCVLCDLTFTSLQLKWDHNWEVHKERKDNADCPICLKSFRKFHDVRVHAREEHTAEVAVIKQRNRSVCFYKVKEMGLVRRRETIVVNE